MITYGSGLAWHPTQLVPFSKEYEETRNTHQVHDKGKI